MFFRVSWTLAAVVGFPLLSVSVPAQDNSPLILKDPLVIRSVGRPGRSPVHTDAVEALVVSGQWHTPAAGDKLTSPNGAEQTWEKATVDKDGWLEGSAARGGYVYWPVVSDRQQTMLLEAAGHNCAYVNGQIRAGDPYAYGYLRLPITLHAGTNDLLFQCSRGRFRAKLIPADKPLVIDTADATLPDIICGDTSPVWGSVVLLNTTTNTPTVTLSCTGAKSVEQPITLPPLGARKAPFLVYPPKLKEPTNFSITISAHLKASRDKYQLSKQLNLRVRRPDQSYKCTFRSSIDDSVQYYAVNPAPPSSSGVPAPALFLSLHGAGVEAMGQADAYSPKKWGNIVCPTNRRPYGFDWEEWGRVDALEVLGLAEGRFNPDPAQVYLTGHSMGGHGTWQLGALYPDRFAAIGPSAGWISFTSYVETNRPAPTNTLQAVLRQASAASDTLLMATNYLQEGVYILHGDSDDNVPVSEARRMRQVLGAFHRDFDFHEQPGAGHWWDALDEPGTDCVDWAPMFDFFARHKIPSDDSIRRIRFVTVNPAVSSRSHWVTVLAQEHHLEPSVVDIRTDPGKRRIAGSTTNVAAILFELPSLKPGQPLSVELDGQKLENIAWPSHANSNGANSASEHYRLDRTPSVCLVRQDGKWQVGEPPAPQMKNPLRSGPFRQAFYNHMLFVYGTQGTPDENAWALNRARFDAETMYYRGNGSVDILSDTAYLGEIASAAKKKSRSGVQTPALADRNVILYGNADGNAAWASLLGSSPVQVRRGLVRVGARELKGDNLACLFLQPSRSNDSVLVGVVSGSGLPGLRLTERLPYVLAGGGFPDCFVAEPSMLTQGMPGVVVAGFFGPDWSVASGEFGWRD